MVPSTNLLQWVKLGRLRTKFFTLILDSSGRLEKLPSSKNILLGRLLGHMVISDNEKDDLDSNIRLPSLLLLLLFACLWAHVCHVSQALTDSQHSWWVAGSVRCYQESDEQLIVRYCTIVVSFANLFQATTSSSHARPFSLEFVRQRKKHSSKLWQIA